MGEKSEVPSMKTRIRLNLFCKNDDEDMVSHLRCMGYPKIIHVEGKIPVLSKDEWSEYEEIAKRNGFCPYYVPEGECGQPEFCAICLQ